MNDSIDSVLYQKHDEKISRIDELWSYKGDSLNVEDINPEDLKLDLIKDPNKKSKLILEEETKEYKSELSKLNLKIKDFDSIIEKRKQLELDFKDAEQMEKHYEHEIEDYKNRNMDVPDWVKTSLKMTVKDKNKAENQMEKVNDKLSAINLTTKDEEKEYLSSLCAQKRICEEKIEHVQKTLPQHLEKLEVERMEQKVLEYPVEKQREILEADILNNLRPMKEVEYEIKTIRHEEMLKEKLKAGDITQEEHYLYKAAGYEKYEMWLNGEIESLGEIKKQEPVQKSTEPHQNSLFDENDLFFGFSDEDLFGSNQSSSPVQEKPEQIVNSGKIENAQSVSNEENKLPEKVLVKSRKSDGMSWS